VGVHRNRYEYTENLYNLRASRDEFNDRVIEPQISVHEQIAAAARKNKGGDQDMKVCVHVCACVCMCVCVVCCTHPQTEGWDQDVKRRRIHALCECLCVVCMCVCVVCIIFYVCEDALRVHVCVVCMCACV
jgi:hypothetical protein